MINKKWAAIALSALALTAAGAANAQQSTLPAQPTQQGGQGGYAPGGQGGFAPGGHGGQGGAMMNPGERAAIERLTPAQKEQLRSAFEQVKADHERTRADMERFQALREQFGLPPMHRQEGGGRMGMGGPGPQSRPMQPTQPQ